MILDDPIVMSTFSKTLFFLGCTVALLGAQVRAASETVLFNFAGYNKGEIPYGGLVRNSAGDLYGTTTAGGPGGLGIVFKIDTSGNETIIDPNVGLPYGGLATDANGNLYGTSYEGYGTVFKISPSGQLTILYNFADLDGNIRMRDRLWMRQGTFTVQRRKAAPTTSGLCTRSTQRAISAFFILLPEAPMGASRSGE